MRKTVLWVVLTFFISFVGGLFADAYTPYFKSFLSKVGLLPGRGSLEILVRHQNDELLSCSEVTGFELYDRSIKEGDSYVYNWWPATPSFLWEDLPRGRYAVQVFVNDMYAGDVGWGATPVEVGPGCKEEITIRTINPVQLRVKVFLEDGTTPLPGARVEITSQEEWEYPWRSGETNSEGETPRFYLQPTTSPEEYYKIKVFFDDELVGLTETQLVEDRVVPIHTEVTAPE